MPAWCLSFQAPYACRNSGACCTSGWLIPVETPLYEALSTSLVEHRLTVPEGVARNRLFIEIPGLAEEVEALVQTKEDGTCAFYEQNGLCAIHRQLGPRCLPVSCQHFPRVCVIDEDGIFVTLSHYCPTVAGLLFRDAPLTMAVETPPRLMADVTVEGLDARGELPPLVRPGLLADRASYRTWERFLVATLGRDDLSPEGALGLIADATERLRGWRPGHLRLHDFLDATIADAAGTGGDAPGDEARGVRAAPMLHDLARATVPAGLAAPTAVPGFADAYAALVADRWPSFSRPIRRYLAAKSFANWCAYQGHGFRTVVHSVVAALGVLRVEAARQAARARRPLDEAMLLEAFRASDLLLLHLAVREDLAHRLTAIEEQPYESLKACI